MPQGSSEIIISCDKAKHQPWLEVQLMTEGIGFQANAK